jgi:excisionase family DNA binding protein
MKQEIIILTRNEVQELVNDAVAAALRQNLPESSPGPAVSLVMTLEQVCAYTGLSKDAVYRKTGAGLIPHSKRGKRLYFDRLKIDAWLLENDIDPARIRRAAEKYR